MSSSPPAPSANGLRPARDAGIDRLRGLSVLLMLAANLAPITVPSPRWFVYRVVSSFCAPTFVLLFGVMVGKHRPQLPDLAVRAATLLGVAALIDVAIWGVRPFFYCDILYLVGLGLPFVALCCRLPMALHAACALAVVTCSSWLRLTLASSDLPQPVENALFLGWFPVFPWLGWALFGAALGRYSVTNPLSPRTLVGVAAALVTTGLAVAFTFRETLRERGGYAELFYPATYGVLASLVGLSLAAWPLLQRFPTNPFTRFLEAFGRRSLVVYIVHIALLGRLIHPLVEAPSQLATALGLAGLFIAAWASVTALDRLRWRPTHPVLKTILGG